MKNLHVVQLKKVIERVLQNPGYALQARRIQQAIRDAGGVRAAANIIENSLNAS